MGDLSHSEIIESLKAEFLELGVCSISATDESYTAIQFSTL